MAKDEQCEVGKKKDEVYGKVRNTKEYKIRIPLWRGEEYKCKWGVVNEIQAERKTLNAER